MSEIKTDKLTGTSTAGSILVTGEGNSTTTNLQQGLAKVWFVFENVSATPVYIDSFNCSTLTDSAAGEQIVNFANDMGNTTYCLATSTSSLAGISTGTTMADDSSGKRLAGSVAMVTHASTSGDLRANKPTDFAKANGIIMGDLA